MPELTLFHPTHWPTWLGFGLLRILAFLPYQPLMAVGRLCGYFVYLLATRRRRIAETNLRLCFPEQDEAQRQVLLKQYFASVGMGIMDVLIAWWWSDKKIASFSTISGRENLDGVFDHGQGVIFFTIHMSSLETSGRILLQYAPLVSMYRQHENPVVQYVMRKMRERHLRMIIPRDDVRAMIKTLRNNQGVWFAPDQNYGHKHSLFVEFFGVPAATNTSTSRLAGLTGAKVVPYITMRRPEGGYLTRIEPALDNFPSGDTMQDTQRLHRIIEQWIREAPEQYNWMHRRFKDRPNHEPRFY